MVQKNRYYQMAISQGIKSSLIPRLRRILNYPDYANDPFTLPVQQIGGGGQPLFGASGPMDDDEMDAIWNEPPAAEEDRDYYWELNPVTQEVIAASQADPAPPIGEVKTYDEFLQFYGLERAPSA
jgi:hypothetical protein